jgi:hypothetical protein
MKLRNSIVALTLLLWPVTTAYAQQPTPRCVTLEEVQDRYFKGMDIIDLQGAKLAAFKTAYKQKTGEEAAPDITRLVFVKYSPELWALVIFRDGCVTDVIGVEPEAAQQLLNFSARFRAGVAHYG